MRKQSSAPSFRITGARQGLTEDVRGRQRRYVISMSVRTVAVVLTAVLWNVERPIAIITLIAGLVLPYIAVVIANAGRENVTSLPSTFVATPSRPMLTSSADESPREPGAEGGAEAGHTDSAEQRGEHG
ncbi:DUF3099 domain-containing protein [Streptomyces purpurogeneiscleroticus]|uniref:DUF3099 domain-containing protein n=1 Tax=Streptomyces purpurogeneiscleroticus TaxID=68259 RepID=UPI001CBD8A21|nr:DUF3099 domain-containing protein [Streptomyces purpurogeneiscleroticus]MBZ4019714.1 hypothetical protein [Streptomyces purpurogeneiscleroticus]